MSLRHQILALAPVLWLGPPYLEPPPSAAADYEQVFDELRRIAPRGDRVAAIKDLVLRRDVMEFRLTDGSLSLLTPVANQTVGAVFVGTGTASLAVPLAVERQAIRRVLKDSLLDTPITALVLFFADSTLAELERQLTFGPGAPGSPAAGLVGDALDYLTDGGERWGDATLMSALLNDDANGLFYAYIKRQRGEHLMFQVDPQQLEEILLLRRGRLRGQRIQTVAQFHRAHDLRDGAAVREEQPDPLQLDGYHIEATIDGDFDFSARATIRLTARRDRIRWVPFSLYSELGVDSVVDQAGARATFFRHKNSAPLWIRFDPVIRRGESRAIQVAYHGDLIDHGSLMERFLPPPSDPRRRNFPAAVDRWAFIKSTWTWFPRYSEWQAADMDLTFHTPTRYRLASVGKLVESRVERGVLTTHWVTEAPTEHASFNIGEFREFQIMDPRIPPVTVHMNAEAHAHLSQLFLSQRNPEQEVGADVANSLAFFTRSFGPPLFQKYYATEIPYSHGQAFPGLIHLSWWTFQSSMDSKGWEEIFRAHEMAHQWWGIGVEPVADRDAWLSEGFAMFAGLWYMQLVLRDNEKYFKQLQEWRQLIRSVRDDALPVGVGYRVAQSDPEHYNIVVYRKGAWVLHMLRNLMLDYRDMKEDAFLAMMKDFYTSHRGQRASTADFQAVVERHLQRPMGWFFEQWVDGTDIPTYTLSWRSEREADGQHLLKLRIRQADVPDSFRMPVPVRVENAAGERTIVRVEVSGPMTEVELRLPAEPKVVELNPLESVLAEVKTERWR